MLLQRVSSMDVVKLTIKQLLDLFNHSNKSKNQFLEMFEYVLFENLSLGEHALPIEYGPYYLHTGFRWEIRVHLKTCDWCVNLDLSL